MISRTLLVAVAALAVLAAPAAAQQPVVVKDAADLFPPDSVVYVEIVKPADLAREVAAFTKGTIIDDMPAFMAKWREKRVDGYYPASIMLGMVGTFAGPEALAEFSRMQGAAFAITGMDKKKFPEMVGVLLPGSSNVPGFVMRMLLSVESPLVVAGKVEGVTIYGDRPSRVFNRVGPGGAPPAPAPIPPPEAPFIAYMPGALIMGSSLESVSDVIKRLKGTEKRLALSGDAGFKDASALRQRPGIYAYVNPTRGLEVVETLLKSEANALPPMAGRAITELLNPKALRAISANLSLVDGTLDLRLAAKIEAGKSSPLLDLIADQKVSMQMLQPVPKDSVAAFTLALTDGEKHWKRLLAAADAIVGDDGPKPSDQVKEIEEKLKVNIGKEILGRMAAITVALPAKQELPKGATEVPMLFITGTDAAATERLEQMVAPLVGLVVGEVVEPVTETIQGVKVRSIPGTNLPWKAPLHFGRNGTTLALGADRKLVAASLAGKIGDSLVGEPQMSEALKGADRSAAVGVWRWGTLMPELLVEMSKERVWVNGKRQEPEPAKLRERVEQIRKAQAGLIQSLPPLVVSIARGQQQLEIVVQQRHLPGAAAKLIEGVFDAIMGSAKNLFEEVGGAIPPPPPAPIKN